MKLTFLPKFSAIFMVSFLVVACAVTSMGEMLPGSIYREDGVLLEMKIEVSRGYGKMTAVDTKSGEAFKGTYSAMRAGYSPGMSKLEPWANAVGTLIGNSGTVLECQLEIQTSVYVANIHGKGIAVDRDGRKYQS
jgi:hypothetical protein